MECRKALCLPVISFTSYQKLDFINLKDIRTATLEKDGTIFDENELDSWLQVMDS